jgi:hypothetical protein
VASDGGPYIRIDPTLDAFARRHGVELYKNYRGADRSLRFNDALSRAIWIHAMDLYGATGTYQVSVAHEDRPERYARAALVADSIAPGDLDGILERAAAVLESWSARDLEHSPQTT